MKPSTKAALYNALLLPGWGHFYLKEYKRGVLIFIPFLAGLLWICWAIFQAARAILISSPFKKGTVDIAVALKLAADSVNNLNLEHYAFLLFFIILLWIISIADAYYLGRKHFPG